ncbi:T9SS type A sorting domain-containing protein [Polaribacter haliotis]|uniref:T9SS type A sorting domain-containing protein n=2 Tax=Polaribacter haliotis TaxID=1888915 RepID=A0A7L8AKI3_9FLAO|nr:T9SS type A sorting domain-containing protein [Polaribacter haliotis]
MKKILQILCLCFVGFITQAQEQSKDQLFVGNAAVDYRSDANNLYMQMQVGSPIISVLNKNDLESRTGFPYGILYISPTFVVDGFEISKGYFSDKINIKWEFGGNQHLIEKVNIYRKEFGSTIPYQFIGSVSKDVFEYNDAQIEGGTLYEYKVEAFGVSAFNERFVNFIDGVGFRNPTATVSGSISFEGGSPVQDVIVFAEANGEENTTRGSSLKIDNGYVSIDEIKYDIGSNNTTLQAWITNYGEVFKFTTKRDEVVQLYAGKLDANSIQFQLKVNGTTLQETTIANSFPTGELDFLGRDVFSNISTLTTTSFVHVSATLEDGKKAKFYVNGREITEDYVTNANVPEGVLVPAFTNPISINYDILDASLLKKVVLADAYVGYLDEVRVWQKIVSNEAIRRDYRRYLSGGEAGLSLYLRMNETTGTNVYDLSKKGFRQNKNDGIFVQNAVNGVLFNSTKPTKKQLGVFGVTDANGSYTIASIPYSGSGESFVVTPSFGVHSFEPASQTLFLGADASVVNQLNFKDVSSFKFNGRAVYNVQNVFKDNPLDVDVVDYNTKSIEDFGYNQYRIDGSVIINKAEFYYEGGAINPLNGFYEGGELKRYPVIGLEKAYIYIDGDIVIDEDNQPVETKANGDFTINVPIGKHKIEVRKDGHVFEHSGYFPASGTFEFFEDQIERTWFIDKTRISLIGKVVGGKIESDKPLGFGLNGVYTHINNEGEENEENEIVSSLNNIGVANIILKGDINTSAFDVPVATNPATGEYEVSLIPYIYYIKSADLKIPSNTDVSILSSNETLNLLATPVLDSIKHITKDGSELFSKAFHHKKSFRYNSPVMLTLVNQEYEKEIKIGDKTFDISGLDTPIYIQKQTYNMLFEVTQNYINKDASEDKITKEYFTEGAFNINNNVEISGESSIKLVNNNRQYKYSFKAGEPNTAIADNFKSAISVAYNIAGSNALTISNISDFKSEGIVKGGASTGGVAFATYAPEVPDIILRDPPGSNSFASIEKGTTITFTTENANTNVDGNGGGLYVSLGPTFETSAGTPFFAVGYEANFVADVENNFSHTIEETKTNTVTKTYTFNKTISTSDDVDFVGSDGDLYIGNSKNVYYGIFNNMFVTDAPIVNNNGATIDNIEVTAKDKDNNDVTLYISTNKDYFIGEQPTKTFFTYSQKYIVETLIPELEALAANFVPNPTPDPSLPLVTADSYTNQANLWRKVIQNNEKTKYDAKNNKEAYRSAVLATIQNEFESYKNPFTGEIIYTNEYQAEMDALVNENFFSNQSFDAGVGEFTSSITTAQIGSYTYENTIDIGNEFKAQLGLLVNNVGAFANYTKTNSWINADANTSEQEVSSTISYTLKDNDLYNVLSVDIVNMFDGNGPVFITKAGATSCPYEAETTSLFYKTTGYNKDVIGVGGEILSDPTNRVYLPEVKSDKTVLKNIPESEGALFTLLLKNNSDTQSDLEYIIEVDALTLNGATTNVEANGVNVYIPYNETVEFPFEVYKSSASSIFEYNNIRVYLKSPCDDINDSEGFIDVSVEFKKSCSKVTVSAPENNFIFNRAEAFSQDVNGNTINNSLPITFTDFNTDFNGFKKIELQYRNASSANWIKFKTYYGTQTLLNEASDTSGEVIDSANSDYTFNWDVVGDKIPDGKYEFRAISYCTDDVTNISPIISGTINLNAPVLFGTPQPSDGILDVGEDVSVRFNEAIFESGTTAIKVTGLSNQQAIDHNVSVFLDGSENQIELPNQVLPKGSFTVQFWYKNSTTGNGNLITQENGINASLIGNELTFSVGSESVKAVINPAQYNFYSLVYQKGVSGDDTKKPLLLILENGTELVSEMLDDNLDLNSNSSIFIGGNNTIGNIHDIRFWSKTFTRAQATVAKDKTLTGRELNLLGYWTLAEGNGKTGVDKAKRRNAIVNLDWDIKPKGTAYVFANDSYLSLENVGFVQPSISEDITLSFWIKTATASESTIFSNGKGNDEDFVQTNGLRNKWSINMKSDGNLELISENIGYNLTTISVADGVWHHIALVVKRGGSINSYVDALETTSVSSENIGGISGNQILIGARLFKDTFSNVTIDNHFTGSLDEIRLWNTARSFEQIKRDRYFEIDAKTEGLMLYVDFNQEDTNTTNGPKYNHLAINNKVSATFSILSGSTQSYTEDSPALKPKLQFTNIPFSTVINGDQMIIQPELTTEEWSLFEGQILDFSVSRMSDTHFNEQLSPVSWSAFINRQEIEWFTKEQTKEIVEEKNVNEDYSFTMDIVNKGGSNQPYKISGLPTWVTVKNSSGTVTPNATKQIVFTVDKELSMGTYNANIFLETASEFNDRLTLDLRVLTPAPDWSVNSPDFSNSMNVIGKIKINDVFSRDQYTKIGAFVDNNPRGEGYLRYDVAFDSYFVYLTTYSNVASGEEVTFKIWDAVNGKILVASINGSPKMAFLQNEVLGSKTNPTIFSGAEFAEQETVLNKGWTWVSFFVEDSRFTDVKSVFNDLVLQDDDQVKSQNQFTRFEADNWFGSLTTIENTKMYKVKLANENSLKLIGNDVDESSVNLIINEGWNWLPFPIHRNISLQEALTFYNPTDGDVIKDQYTFAIYDANSGWSGTLNYMQSSRGYMIKSGASQSINYPNSNSLAKPSTTGQEYSSKTIHQFSKYSSNMSVVAEIIGSEEMTSVVVYDAKGVLRGASPIINFGDKKMSFVTVFSDTEDALQFRLSDGISEIDVSSEFVFENNKVFGNMKIPVILNSKSLSNNDLFLSDVVLYPNPFSSSIIIDASNQNEKLTHIEIFSTIGVLVKKVIVNSDKTTIDTSNIARGVYLIKINAESGKSSIQKMVKK